MAQAFLESESIKANKKKRKLFSAALIFFIVVGGGLFFVLKDSLDLSDPSDHKLAMMLLGLAALMLISCTIGFAGSLRVAKKGQNLILPYDDVTKEEAAGIINAEEAEGRFLVDEYIYDFSDGKKPYGEKVILTPTYLLLDNGLGKIKAIPRSKIYWLCAQVGRKGSSSFVVRLLVFTQNGTFYVDGTDVPHVEEIAEKLYKHIPNVFSGYDPFMLSYKLEEMFNNDRAGFMEFYKSEKNKHGQTADK